MVAKTDSLQGQFRIFFKWVAIIVNERENRLSAG